jgi:ABC-type multidrug transport system ATPase subunit
MIITLEGLGKRYLNEWVISGLDHTFESGRSYAVIGPNGAGKSTLLQLITGHLIPSRGTVSYEGPEGILEQEDWFTQIAFSAPYMEVIEEFTFNEMVSFHVQFKTLEVSAAELAVRVGLEDARDKQVRHYSSGMKQRLRLGLALFSKAPVILLDEPGTNLDEKGREWYRETVTKQLGGKTLIVASNVREEYDFCEHTLSLS